MKKVLIANWKQNMNMTEVMQWLFEFSNLVKDFTPSNLDVILCPSYPHLSVVSVFANKYTWLFVGSQDISASDKGRHTGEVGVFQVKDFVDYCIVGHSERGEDENLVVQKIEQVFSGGLTPIICFVDPRKLSTLKRENAIMLWEDPENISKDDVFTPKPAEEIAKGARQLKEKYDITAGLIYGGSINRQNAKDLSNISELDGGIVGGASLDPTHFFEIMKAYSK